MKDSELGLLLFYGRENGQAEGCELNNLGAQHFKYMRTQH
jgi:hypothetical protein